MVYEIEFIRRGEGKAEAPATAMVCLLSEGLTDVILKPDELFRHITVPPRADGYRIREGHGPAVYEFLRKH